MTRASVFRRSPVLVLAAALVALAAVLVHDARPAQAQSNTIWSATLTVGGTNIIGCLEPVSNNRCSDKLTSNSFTFGGVRYQVTRLYLSSGDLYLVLNKRIPAVLKAQSLRLDGVEFLGSEAHLGSSDAGSNDLLVWQGNSNAPSWSAGDTVQVSLEFVPPEVTVSASGPLREGGPPVRVRFNLNRPAPTNLHATLGHNDSVRFNADGPRFATNATRAVMELSVPQDQIDNNCRTLHLQVWFLPYVGGEQLQADVAFTVIDDDGAADTCSGLLGSPYPTQLSLQFVEASRWTEKIRVTYLAQLDRPPLNRNVVSVSASSIGGNPITQRDGFSGAVGDYYVPRDQFSIWAPHTNPKYTDTRGTHDWPIEIWIWDSAPDQAFIHVEATTQFPALSATQRFGVGSMRHLADRQSSDGNAPERGNGGSPGSDCEGCGRESELGVIRNPNAPENPNADLIADVKEWRDDPRYVSDKRHTDRWDRVLLALGAAVSDQTLQPMTASEAQGYADRGWTRWEGVAETLAEIEAAAQQQVPPSTGPSQDPADEPPAAPNNAPTVVHSPEDVTIGHERGSKAVPLYTLVNDTSLSSTLVSMFHDADGDDLTITAASSTESVATVSVSGHTATVSARSRGTATITVTADDGRGGTVSDDFTVTVKSAPTVASAIGDVSGLEAGSTRSVSLSGVFRDADGDDLTITASALDDRVARVTAASDGSALTVRGVSAGVTTITVVARDTDGNRVADSFDVSVEASQPRLLTPPTQQQPPAQDPTPTPTPTPETDPGPAQEPETSDIVDRYDADGDGSISRTELGDALKGYAAGEITYSEMLEVYTAFRAS